MEEQLAQNMLMSSSTGTSFLQACAKHFFKYTLLSLGH